MGVTGLDPETSLLGEQLPLIGNLRASGCSLALPKLILVLSGLLWSRQGAGMGNSG